MSRAQKLVNRALEILQRQQSGALNDQKALVEIRGLLDRTEDDGGVGTASEQVKLARKVIQQHREFALNDQQAVSELTRIFSGHPHHAPAAKAKA